MCPRSLVLTVDVLCVMCGPVRSLVSVQSRPLSTVEWWGWCASSLDAALGTAPAAARPRPSAAPAVTCVPLCAASCVQCGLWDSFFVF